MKYEYCGISLGDDIKDIINKFDISKIEYEKDLKYLSFKLGKISQKTNLECFLSIPIKIGKVIYIIIFDENFKLFNELEIWQELTDEIKEKYELYYDEDDDNIYLSKKYKYLKIGVDGGYGEMEEFKDYKERIFSFIFDAQDDICWILQQDKITNYLECKNLQDIYNSLYDSKTLDVNIEKREIYGQLDNYKFIFSLLTRDIKSIQNLETGEFLKTSLDIDIRLGERQMKQILYEDNNNNANYLINILAQVQQQVETVIFWELSCFDFVIVDIGDFFNGIMPPKIEEVYNFEKKIEREHVIIVEHNYLIKMLKNIRTVYYANMKTVIGNDVFSIKIFDGDMIEIRGNIENNIML